MIFKPSKILKANESECHGEYIVYLQHGSHFSECLIHFFKRFGAFSKVKKPGFSEVHQVFKNLTIFFSETNIRFERCQF